HDLALPAQVDSADPVDAIDEKPLDVELLQVDERRLLGCAEIGQALEVEGKDFVVSGERAPDGPGNPARGDAIEDAEPLEDFQALLRVADAAARCTAHADRVVLVEHHHWHTMQREITCRGETSQSRADHNDRVATDLAAQLGRLDERINRQFVGAAGGHASHLGDRRHGQYGGILGHGSGKEKYETGNANPDQSGCGLRRSTRTQSITPALCAAFRALHRQSHSGLQANASSSLRLSHPGAISSMNEYTNPRR